MTYHSIALWIKANDLPVCFSAKGNQHGTINTPWYGKVGAVKLVHLYGFVTCHKHNADNWSFWGCGHGLNQVNVVMTRSNNQIILPANQFIRNAAGKWYKVPGYDSFSPEIILSVFSNPPYLPAGTQLRVWYGEDLVNYTEADNDGRVCTDVYVLYVWEVDNLFPLLFTL